MTRSDVEFLKSILVSSIYFRFSSDLVFMIFPEDIDRTWRIALPQPQSELR
jgi:hypothetical protein